MLPFLTASNASKHWTIVNNGEQTYRNKGHAEADGLKQTMVATQEIRQNSRVENRCDGHNKQKIWHWVSELEQVK